MKIPNHDKKHKESKRKLNGYLDEDFRMLITGQARYGKTNTLTQILREPLLYYDKIFIYTPNQHQEKMVDFQQIMDNWYHKKPVSYNVLELGNADDILVTVVYVNI